LAASGERESQAWPVAASAEDAASSARVAGDSALLGPLGTAFGRWSWQLEIRKSRQVEIWSRQVEITRDYGHTSEAVMIDD
jgi:hypothetical protein